MRPPRLMLSAVTRRNRHDAMADINDAVAAAGGWVEGHTLFSNIATTFRVFLPEGRIGAFADAVERLGVHVDAESRGKLASLVRGPSTTDDERALSLNLTFLHDEPDLRREVPMVPG